ncbi:gamma-glutamylaminecyclotransferase B-like isoform X1 [Pimephales promelas]|uniref:gamma-glutamylaminecyclotransferase B-like isoform X1 n=1 Tax=Pimephales promelas TaxID=90988 RepID=UPI001955840D|nr:gamma-glutamylaminecyclotransferase B-like isoform X1 [Pimephales promelas]
MKGFGLLSIIVSVFPAAHMAKVFVYGTLKKGQPNHFIMKDHAKGQAEFVAHARTVDPYPLVIATEYNIPFLLVLDKPGTGQRVHGEIYSVDQKMLEFLDEFEECPQMYQRTLIRLEVQDGPGGSTPETGSSIEAYVYTTDTYEPEWLEKTTYESYDSNGDHGLPYVPH